MKINYSENLNKIGFFWEKDLDSDNELLIQVKNDKGILTPKVVFTYNEETNESRHEFFSLYPERMNCTICRNDLSKKDINDLIKSDSEICIKVPWDLLGVDKLPEAESYLEVVSPIEVPNDYFNVEDYKVYLNKGIYYIHDETNDNIIGTSNGEYLYLTLNDYNGGHVSIISSFDEDYSISVINKILRLISRYEIESRSSIKFGRLLLEINKIAPIDRINDVSYIEYANINGKNTRIKQSISAL